MVEALLVASGGLVGFAGSMVGIGGGVLLVPILVLGFGVPMADAVPVSLLCVVAGSTAAAGSYVEARLADLRLALVLEVGTVGGAVAGSLISSRISPAILATAFGVFTLGVAGSLARPPAAMAPGAAPARYGLGLAGSFLAGSVSALLGVGGGPIKVPLMAYGMRVPLRVAAATSNLMVGVTAAASVAAYAARGQLKLALAAPLVLGALGGATVGSRVMQRVPNQVLRWMLATVLVIVSVQMFVRGAGTP